MRSTPASDRPRASRAAPRAAAGLALSALALIGCGEPAPARPACPDGLHEDESRAGRLVGLLDSTGPGRDLLRRAPALPRICFGDVAEPAITSEGVVLLDPRDDDGEAAARLGHLVLHVVEGLPMSGATGPERPCRERVDDAVRAEARAHALELELRRRLGVTRPRAPFAFENAYWAAPQDRRVEVIRAWFEAHPAGGGGVPGFVDAYGRACAGRDR
jgi:hypothetical protein